MSDINKITFMGVLSALIFIGTWLIKFPIIHGYLNFGDGFILISGIILGPIAAIPAAIGSSLADIISGYSLYSPFTFIIKGTMGFVSGKLLMNKNELPTFILVEFIMIVGYMLSDSIIFTFKGAILSLPFNILQGIFAIIFALIGSKVIKKYNINLINKL